MKRKYSERIQSRQAKKMPWCPGENVQHKRGLVRQEIHNLEVGGIIQIRVSVYSEEISIVFPSWEKKIRPFRDWSVRVLIWDHLRREHFVKMD